MEREINLWWLQTKMKRCPNCDTYFGKPQIWMTAYPKTALKYEVACPVCDYHGKRAFTMRGAVRKWNHDRKRFGRVLRVTGKK